MKPRGKIEANLIRVIAVGILVTGVLFAQTEFLIDSSQIYSVVSSQEPDVSYDGTNYFIVWDTWATFYPGIYGGRISSSGEIIDTVAIWIGRRGTEHPRVAFNGTNYLVVWREGGGTSADIYGARVTPDGVVLDFPEPIPICIDSSQYGQQQEPDVYSDGQNWLVVWTDMRSGGFDLYGRIVDGNGGLYREFILSNSPYSQGYSSISSDGTNYFVVWRDRRQDDNPDIYGARVDAMGNVLDPTGIILSGSQAPYTEDFYPRVDFDGTRYLVVWQRDVDPPFDEYDIYGRFVETTGNPGPEPFAICGDGVSGITDTEADIGFNGLNYLVSWRCGISSFDIYGARITPSGEILDPSRILICDASGSQMHPEVTSNGLDFFTIWQDQRGTPSNPSIYASRIDSSGTVLDTDGFPVPFIKYSESYDPSVAFNGTDYLTVWTTDRFVVADNIYGSRVAADGQVLDPDGISICTYSANKDYPAVGSDGTDFLVTWEDWRIPGRGIFGSIVDSSGVASDTMGFSIFTSAGTAQPDIAFDGVNYLVVYGTSGIGGTRVGPSGILLDSFIISNYGSIYSYPSICFGNSHYFVVWTYMLGGGEADVYGVRIDTSGNVIDSTEIFICTAPYVQSAVDVSFDGTNYFVVWSDQRTGMNFDIYGARVDTAGNVLDPSGILIFSGPGEQTVPSVAYDGSNYVVVWEDWQDYMMPHSIYGAAVSQQGNVVNTFLVSINPGGEGMRPSVVCGAGDSIFATYVKSTGYPYNGRRIWGTFIYCVSVEENAGMNPQKSLLSILPNPCSKNPLIRFLNPLKQDVTMVVYDIAGRELTMFYKGILDAGMHDILWDRKDHYGKPVAAGVYLLYVKAGNLSLSKKIVLIKEAR